MTTSRLKGIVANEGKFRTTKTLMVLGLGVAVLAGCSSGEEAPTGEPSETVGAVGEDSAVQEDLREAGTTVSEALVDYPDVTQVVLSDAANQATLIYGALEVPFEASEATTELTRTVEIVDGGNFVIEAESAASGETWAIDQDGNVTAVEG